VCLHIVIGFICLLFNNHLNFIKMRNPITKLKTLNFLLALSLYILSIKALAIRPTIIPALGEWTDGSGSFTLNATSRIVMDNVYTARLSSTSSIFSSDTQQLIDFTIHAITTASANACDIFLPLGSSDA
jgi:hypothetical protein